MTPDGKGYLSMAAAEVYTALVAVKTALRTPEDLEKLSAGAKSAQHAIDQSGSKKGRGAGSVRRKPRESSDWWAACARKS